MSQYEHDRQRTAPAAPLSGADVDAWGGEDTHESYCPRPYTDDPCVRKIDGRCTCEPGLELCLIFKGL